LRTPLDADVVAASVLSFIALALVCSGRRIAAARTAAAVVVMLIARGYIDRSLDRSKQQKLEQNAAEQAVADRFRPRHYRSIPRSSALLRAAGTLAFGARLDTVINQTAPPREVSAPMAGSSIWLVQHPADDTVGHLQHEVPTDPYGLARLKRSGTGLVVDIGANIGDHAIVAMAMRPEGQVCCP